MTEPIVIGIALRDDDAAPLALARDLGRFTGAPLALVHVIRYDPLTPLPAERFEDPQRERTRSDLARVAASLLDGAEATLHVEFSPSIVRGVHDAAERLRASAVVVGSSHRGRLGRTMPGGVGERLLHAAPSAVAIAPRGYRGTDGGFRHIGVAFTDTPEGREALSAATAMATLGNAKLSTYTVVDGDPARALAEASTGVDLLVCGSRGYGPLRSAMLGGVSAKLAHSCACPLIVLPRQGEPTPAGAAAESGLEAT